MRPTFGISLAERFGGDRQTVDVGQLALVGRHAVGGEALDMLDRMHAFAHGKADILGADIVLEVDEGLDGGVRPGAFGSTGHAAGPVEGLLALRSRSCRRRRSRLACAISSPAASASSMVACRSLVPLQAPTDRQSCA